MAKFSKKRFDKYVKRNIDKITQGYQHRGGKVGKTSGASKRLARKAFEKSVKGIMEKNPNLTQSEASLQALRSTKFNIYSDIAKENWRNMLKEAGINVQLRSLEFIKTQDGSPIYRITRGKYAGKYTLIKHFPGQDPSFQVVLVDEI